MATIAALFPLVFVQEAWRGVLVGRGRPRSAAFNDGVRAALQIGAMMAVIALGRTATDRLLSAWGLAGGVAACLGAIQIGGAPSPTAGLRFARRHLDISRFLVAEWVLVLGAAQVGLLAVAWLGTPADVGSLRGAQTLLGPMNILGLGVFSFLLTELVRRPDLTAAKLRTGGGGVRRRARRDGRSRGACCLLALPDAVGVTLLGETWSGARDTVLLP